VERPETHYAQSGDLQIAYQVVGDGPLDLVFVPMTVSHIDAAWDVPEIARLLERLASFSRLIAFDRRGSGMSDGTPGVASLEGQVDDVRAVLRAVGSEQAVLLSVFEGCALSALFAASHPELVRALVMMTPLPRILWAPDYDWALTAEQRDELVGAAPSYWGRDSPDNPWLRAAAGDPETRRTLARLQRMSMSPAAGAKVQEIVGATDVRQILPSIQCPTLVVRQADDVTIDERHSRYVVEHVPDTRYVELGPGGSSGLGDVDALADEIEHFLTGVRRQVVSERLLATVLFTDIVGSTERASELGDSAWRSLLERHDALVREEVERHRGRFVKSLGDGVLAVFDGPSRAISSAAAIRDRVAELGLQIRAGLHTGECELFPDYDVGGLAVHIGSRISSLAGSGEVLVSSTVRDLSVGSGQTLTDRGEHELKGVPGSWRVFALEA